MRWGGATIVVATMFAGSDVFAAEETVETLEKELAHDYDALTTQDCVTACKALASIRRAADKICGLEHGPRCADARAKADDAQRRVQAACPDCQVAAAPPRDEERRATDKPPYGYGKAGGAAAPPSEDRRGGCASCNTPGERPTGDVALFVVAALAMARALRSRARARTK